MSDTFEAARAIINSAWDHPDPEGALERLEAEAPPDEKLMFPAFWEALALTMNDTPPEGTRATFPLAPNAPLGHLTRAGVTR